MEKIFILIVLSFNMYKTSGKLQDLDTYTTTELSILPELRQRILPILAHKCMHENRYLVRYLRAKNNNLEATVDMIKQTAEWRNKHDVNNLIYKDFKALYRKLPFYLIADRTGRPTAVAGLRDLDLRKLAITTGGTDRVRDYVIYGIERGIWNLHFVTNSTNTEIIEVNIIFNMAGFNLRSHLCGACIPLWIELVVSYEAYYPSFAHKIILINAPRVFVNALPIIRPFGITAVNRIKIYGVDKSTWLPVIRKLCRKEDLEPEFGGVGSPKPLYKLTREQIEMALGPQYLRRNSTNVIF